MAPLCSPDPRRCWTLQNRNRSYREPCCSQNDTNRPTHFPRRSRMCDMPKARSTADVLWPAPAKARSVSLPR
jgi:hypothetical protein